MARRRKTRTHLKRDPGLSDAAVPKSFIVKHGQVGSALTQLVRDIRKVMEPNTASRLKERTRNKLKDYLTLAPALQVTHLLAFTLTDIAPSFRIVRLPGGPSLSFRVERYSLVKDVLNCSKRARSIGLEYLSPPLLILASFPPPSPTTPPHLSLVMKSFQSLFPPLSPGSISLSSARRVVLISYNSEQGTIDFRHYLITVKPYGVSKRVRKVLGAVGTTSKSQTSSGVLDLGNEKDVADFLLRRRGESGPGGADGYETAASEMSSAAEDDYAEETVSLAGDYVGRNNKKGQKRAVKLDEIGPRMELRLIKITEGMPGKEGNVIYHELVKKSKKEAAALKIAHTEKEKLRKERREEQERNVERKKLLQKGKQEQGESGHDADMSEAEDQVEVDEDAWDEDEDVSDAEEETDNDVSEDDEPKDPRPAKKVKLRGKR